MKLIITLFFKLLACFVSISCLAHNSDKIELISYVEHQAVIEHYLPIVKEAYQGIGLEPKFIAISDKRSLRLLESGQIDADVTRIEDVINSHSSFIKVPPKLGDVSIYLACQPSIECNLSILNNNTKHLGVVGKVEYFDSILANKNIQIFEAPNFNKLIQLFRQKKLDSALVIIDDNTFNESELFANRILISRKAGYHLIHKRYQHLVPALSPALQQALERHKFK